MMSILSFALSQKNQRESNKKIIILYIKKNYPDGNYDFEDLLQDPYLKTVLRNKCSENVKKKKKHKCWI
jgi:hypothetical protein